MKGVARPLVLLAGCVGLSGCVAAIAPIVAAGAIGGKTTHGRTRDRGATPAPSPVPPTRVAATRTPSPIPPTRVAATPAPSPTPPTRVAATRMPPPLSSAAAPVAPVLPARVSPAPVARQAFGWRAMVTYVAQLVQAKVRPKYGAVLAPGSASGFLPCGAKPFAVIVDADGTVLPRPGAATGASVSTVEAARALDDLRFGHVTMLFTTARPIGEASATESALERAKLGPAMQGRELLFGADGKDVLRAAAAAQYCVLALVGDEAADFSDQPLRGSVNPPWGTGWFQVPPASTTR